MNKKEILETAKKMYNSKLVAGYSGNISVYDDASKSVIITPSSLSYETMQLEDITVIDLDGNIKEGNRKPSSEWKMHVQIYKKNKNIRAVVHTHSPYATGFAVQRNPIPLILIEMVPFIGGDIQVVDFRIPGTADLGNVVAKGLGDRSGCLLANHGVVAVGETLEDAYVVAEYIEDAAKIYQNALATGTPVILSDADKSKMLGE